MTNIKKLTISLAELRLEPQLPSYQNLLIDFIIKLAKSKELHHKKPVKCLFGVRRSRLGSIQSLAVLKQPEQRESAKLAASSVMMSNQFFQFGWF